MDAIKVNQMNEQNIPDSTVSTGAQEASQEQLNSFLRGEMAAVETYSYAVEHAKNPDILNVFHASRYDHQARVMALQNFISSTGGEIAEASGAWGAFAKLIEAGAAAINDQTAVAALFEGEEHGTTNYQINLQGLEPNARDFVQRELLPRQLETARAITELKVTLQSTH